MRRLHRALRFVLATGLALALWTLARPAMAAPAPYCDDRGASAIAPAPVLEAPDVGIERARTAACPGDDAPTGAALTRGRIPSAPPSVGSEPVLPVWGAPRAAPPGNRIDPAPVEESPHDGVRWRVERPPRG